MKTVLQGLSILAVIILIFLIAFAATFALVSAIAFGLGFLLRWVVPALSLFEATLLGTILGIIAIYVLIHVGGALLPEELIAGNRAGKWSTDDLQEHQTIPQERFYQTESERTWEVWLHAELANDIYAEFQDAPGSVSNLNPTQVQELSIRLAEAGINIIKRKTGRARRLSVSRNDLRSELNHMGQKAYEDDILQMALAAINMNLNYFRDPLRAVLHNKSWDAPAEIPE